MTATDTPQEKAASQIPERNINIDPPLADARVGPQTDSRINSLAGRKKSPGLASILSVMPGLGQIYVGQIRRGFVHMGIVALTITVLESGVTTLEPLFGFFLAFFWFYTIIDAHRRAKLYNLALLGGREVELTDDITFPEHGSLWGGGILIVVSLLIFLHTKFDVSMEWIEEYWPLAVAGLGFYLVSKSLKGRKSETDTYK